MTNHGGCAILNEMITYPDRKETRKKFQKTGMPWWSNEKAKQRCTRGYKRYKETSGLIEWKERQIFHSIFT